MSCSFGQPGDRYPASADALGFLQQSKAGRSVRYDLAVPDLVRNGNG